MKSFPQLALVILLSSLTTVFNAHAEITVFDQNDWKIGMGGLVEFDSFYDTTRSFTEVVGSGPVARKATFNGDNGRTEFSLRNTRLFLNVQAPPADGWKTRGYIETDFLGYDPNPASANSPAVSESSFASSPSLRIRHAYISAESDNFQILVGQTWSLFGWQPIYVLSTVTVNPTRATLYQRTAKIGVIKTMNLNETNDLQAGFSLERPTQRDGKIPNLVGALRWANSSRKSGYAIPNGEMKALPLSVAFSGTYRNYDQTVNPTTSTSDTVSVPAFALSANTMIPILGSSDGKEIAGTLTLSGEFTAGRGYGDEFTSWSGGIAQTYTGTPTATTGNTNLDPGLGGYNNSGNFELVKLRTWNTQLQYYLDGKTFFTTGYAQLYSSNTSDFVGSTGITTTGLYDRIESKYINLGHDFTDHIRVAVEYNQFTTHYVSDGATNFDNRYQLSFYFRF